MKTTFKTAMGNTGLTANGANTFTSSLDKNVDMFFLAGASRNMDSETILTLFQDAYEENSDLAVRILLWSRDIRGGAGERHFFRTVYQWSHENSPASTYWLTMLAAKYGSFKDIIVSEKPNNGNLSLFYRLLVEDKNGLAAKWFPRKGVWFNAMLKFTGLSAKALRTLLVSLSNTVEQKMSKNEWASISYKGVPSQAMNKYRKAFYRNDQLRFGQFIDLVNEGKTTLNSGTLFPYQLYQAFNRHENEDVIRAQWSQLPDYITNDDSYVVLSDVSGSMTGLPMDISVSLGVYLSERSKIEAFKDIVITFETNPQFVELSGDVISRFSQLVRAPWGGSTDLEAAFDLILNRAMMHNLAQDQMPNKLIIVSDMEFNQATGGYTNYQSIQAKFTQAGYSVPQVVFWNVNGRVGNVPVLADQANVALVSGASPAIMSSVLSGQDFTPKGIMLNTVMTERYNW